jgi:membrane protein DedA with SNARE-associated domain
MSAPITIGLALGTLVSEDLTSIGAGILVRDGAIGLAPATIACAAGVYLGDLGLWLLGRGLGRRALTIPWISRKVDGDALTALGARIDANLGLAVLGSRFLPGSRLPMYLAVGICGQRPLAFAAWSLLAVLTWTPMLVWLTGTYGAALTEPVVGELNSVARALASSAILLAGWRVIARVIQSLSVRRVSR